MKATLIIEGKEIEIEISKEEYKKLHPSETGYERVLPDNEFYYETSRGCIESGIDAYDYIDNEYYESAVQITLCGSLEGLRFSIGKMGLILIAQRPQSIIFSTIIYMMN